MAGVEFGYFKPERSRGVCRALFADSDCETVLHKSRYIDLIRGFWHV